MSNFAESLINWDRATFLAVNHGLNCPLLDWIMPLVTDAGLGHLQALLIIGVALSRGCFSGESCPNRLAHDAPKLLNARRMWVCPLLICIAVSGLTCTAIKQNTDRLRPWWFYTNEKEHGRFVDVRVNIVPWKYPGKVDGFPSGHTATSVAMATVLTMLYARKRGRRGLVVAAWLWATAVGISRIYVAAHWPLDVLSGAMIGVMGGVGTMLVCRAWPHRRGSKQAVHDPTLSSEPTK